MLHKPSDAAQHGCSSIRCNSPSVSSDRQRQSQPAMVDAQHRRRDTAQHDCNRSSSRCGNQDVSPDRVWQSQPAMLDALHRQPDPAWQGCNSSNCNIRNLNPRQTHTQHASPPQTAAKLQQAACTKGASREASQQPSVPAAHPQQQLAEHRHHQQPGQHSHQQHQSSQHTHQTTYPASSNVHNLQSKSAKRMLRFAAPRDDGFISRAHSAASAAIHLGPALQTGGSVDRQSCQQHATGKHDTSWQHVQPAVLFQKLQHVLPQSSLPQHHHLKAAQRGLQRHPLRAQLTPSRGPAHSTCQLSHCQPHSSSCMRSSQTQQQQRPPPVTKPHSPPKTLDQTATLQTTHLLGVRSEPRIEQAKVSPDVQHRQSAVTVWLPAGRNAQAAQHHAVPSATDGGVKEQWPCSVEQGRRRRAQAAFAALHRLQVGCHFITLHCMRILHRLQVCDHFVTSHCTKSLAQCIALMQLSLHDKTALSKLQWHSRPCLAL